MKSLNYCILAAAAILSPVLLRAQIATGSVTVTVSQTAALQPGQSVFSVEVDSPFTASLSSIVARLSGVGITASNLTNIVSTLVPPPANIVGVVGTSTPTLGWLFQLTVPFSSQKSVAASLAALQNTISQNNSGLALSFSVSSTSSSGQASSSCNLASLVSDARTQAQALASAASQALGGIIGLSSSVSTATTAPCSMAVKYAMGGLFYAAGPNAIAISVSQIIPVSPDQATIAVNVTSPMGSALDDITGALQTAGITGLSFTGMNTTTIYTQSGDQTVAQYGLQWSFTIPAPISSLPTVLAQITAAAQKFTTENSSLSLTFSVGGVSASQPASCPEPALLALAQTQAQQVAAAAGLHAGTVLTLATGESAIGSVSSAGFGGLFASTTASTGSFSTGIQSGTSTLCSMSAQFLLQ